MMDQQIASRLRADPFLLHAPSVYDFRERDGMLFAYLSDRVNVTSVYKMYPIGWFSIKVLDNLHHLLDVVRRHLDAWAGPPAVGRAALWTSDLFRASPVPCFSGRPRTGMTAVSSAAPSMRT